MGEVVAIKTGVVVKDNRQMNEDCVRHLEGLLERAKAGELIGVVTVVEYWDDTTCYQMSGKRGRATVGAIMEAVAELTK